LLLEYPGRMTQLELEILWRVIYLKLETHYHFIKLELEFPISDIQLELDVCYRVVQSELDVSLLCHPVGAGCAHSKYGIKVYVLTTTFCESKLSLAILDK
jgi:hypothetical protein